jgi:tellurite resistance protein
MARREPQNRYDGNAIAIDGFIGTPGRSRATHLGYLPSDVAIRLRSRETQATLANLYKGDDGFMDIEVVVACPAEVEDHLADFDQEARRTWMREICMPGLKILAHIAAVDGSTEAAERGQMEKFARAAALLAQASIPDGLISGAVQDAIGMEPSLAAVRANYKKVTKNDDAAAIVLEFAASLAKEGGVNAQERKVLEMILRAEGKA